MKRKYYFTEVRNADSYRQPEELTAETLTATFSCCLGSISYLPKNEFWQIALPCFTKKGCKKTPAAQNPTVPRMGVIRCRESGPAYGHGPPPAQFVLLSGALKSVMQCKEVIVRISYVLATVKVFCKRLF